MGLVIFTTGTEQTLQFLLDNDMLPYMHSKLNFSLESLKAEIRLVGDNLCESSQVRCTVKSAN